MKYLIVFLVVSQLSLFHVSEAKYGFNYLKRLVKSGKADEIASIVKEGIDVNMVGNCKKTLLIWAAIRGVPRIARILLENGADPDMQEKGTQMTALMYASEKNHPDVAKVLMEFKANKDMTDSKGRTAMDIAKDMGHWTNMVGSF